MVESACGESFKYYLNKSLYFPKDMNRITLLFIQIDICVCVCV